MSKVLATKNVAAVLLGVALVFGFAFAFAAPAKADTLSDLQAQVQALLAQIAAMQGGSSSGSSGAGCYTFTRNQQVGNTGGEVMWIQKFLNAHGAQIAATGAGSPGNETSTFGAKTKAAVVKWQGANSVSPASGYWGPLTRAKANSVCAGSTGTTGTTGGTTPAPTGPGITISASSQPANSLAPGSAVRVPFTTFTLSNNTSAAVTITGINVQRTGLAADANFSGVVLVDQNGLQMGTARTFDSNHNATIGDTFTLAAGASQTYTVGGNMVAKGSLNTGEVASISVTGVNTSVPVSGTLPITGASQTINGTLAIGSVTTAISSFDPNSATTKNIGATGVKFTGVRFTAGSAEDLKLYSIRWRINGSASASDVSNVTTVVNGTSYPTTVSADGRYFTTSFPGGLLIQKGFAIDAYIQGDLTGINSASRTVEFDIDKTSDIYLIGQLYGFGIAMAYNSSGTVSTASTHATTYASSGQPVFQGSTVTIQAGTVTTIQNATTVPSQNIPVNIPNTVLGGFTTNFAGEPVTVSGMNFYITSSGTTSVSELTSVSIVDQNGAVVAGPVDAVLSKLTFSNSVTFPVGSRTYTLKGKIPATGWPNNSTVILNTTPSGWTTPTGQTTGNSITIGTGLFTMNTMTVKTGSLALTAAASPSSQNVVAGAQNLLMANIQFDTSQSGEDVRMSSVPLRETGTGYNANLSGCTLWNGATPVNTGSNIVNTVSQTTYTTFTFDNAVNFAKGTVTTLGLTCNLSSAATSSQTYIWGPNSGDTYTGTGKDSGNTITPTATTGNSGTMTVSSGASVTVAVDASSPSYAVQSAGTTGVTLGVIKIRSANEAYTLQKLGLQLNSGSYAAKSTGSGGSPSSGTGDLVTVYLYNGASLLGTATFTGVSQTATSTFTTPFNVPRDTDTLITVKGDLAGISVSAPGGIGNLVKVDPLNVEGVGQQSGTTVRANATTGVAGVRLFKSYPTVALDTSSTGGLPSTGIADGRLIHFKITANSAGPVGIGQMQFTLSTTTVSITNVALYVFSDSSYSVPISGQGTGGLIGSTYCQAGCTSGPTITVVASSTPIAVPAGTTYYFELRGSVSGSASGASVVTKLLGDTAYTTGLDSNYNVATSAGATSTSADKFTWTGNSTTTADFINAPDWSNSFSIPGLPSSGLIQTRSN